MFRSKQFDRNPDPAEIVVFLRILRSFAAAVLLNIHAVNAFQTARPLLFDFRIGALNGLGKSAAGFDLQPRLRGNGAHFKAVRYSRQIGTVENVTDRCAVRLLLHFATIADAVMECSVGAAAKTDAELSAGDCTIAAPVVFLPEFRNFLRGIFCIKRPNFR